MGFFKIRKKGLTQVFRYKQTNVKQGLWRSIIYTVWQWVVEIDFPQVVEFTFLFLPFLFTAVGLSTMQMVFQGSVLRYITWKCWTGL